MTHRQIFHGTFPINKNLVRAIIPRTVFLLIVAALYIARPTGLSQADDHSRTARASICHNASTKLVTISNGTLSKGDLAFLKSLSDAQALWISGSDVGVELLDEITNAMKSLRELKLSDTPIGSEVAQLASLRNVEVLGLTGPAIKSFPQLERLSNLRVLVIGGSHFSVDNVIAYESLPPTLSVLTFVVSPDRSPSFEEEINKSGLREKIRIRLVNPKKDDDGFPTSCECD